MRIVVINTGISFEQLGREIQAAIERGLDQCARGAEQDFHEFLATWNHQPAIAVEKETMKRTVGSDDQILDWVSNGTAGHFIEPVRARALHFATDIVPKTRPQRIRSEPGSRENYVFATRVWNPGIEPRHIEDAIGDKWDNDLAAETIQAEINKT